LSSIHQATAVLVGKPRDGEITGEDRELAVAFWNKVIENMPDWQRVGTREVASAELRRDYIHAHGIAVQAIGIAGAQLVQARCKNWPKQLVKLRTVDWSRANRKLWDGRALVAGKLNKSRNNVILVGNVVLRALDIPLSAEAQRIERLHTSVATKDDLRAAS
jgi:DNA sulfur modification protein DndB